MKLIVTVTQAPLGSHQMIGRQFSFDEGGCSFGRSTENDLVMPDPNKYVSSRHAMVTFENGVFSVHDQSSNGLFVDDESEPIGKGRSYVLRNGTTLKAGEYLMEISIEADAAVPEVEAETNQMSAPPEVRPNLQAVPTPAVDAAPGQDDAAAASPDELALQLAMRLGLHGMTEEKLRQMPDAVTEVIRSCITGIMDVLSSRRQVKTQLKMDMTVIQGARNNALKFSASADEAIERMFSNGGESYLPPETALLEAFHDIADHQIAMMAATMQVHQRVVERFDPEVLEQRLKSDSKGRGLFSGEPRLWEEFKKQYSDIASGGHPSLHDDFVSEFSTAYSEHLRKLKQERSRVE